MRTAVEVDLHLNRLIWAEKRVELNWLLKILILPRSTEKIRLHGAYTTLNLNQKRNSLRVLYLKKFPLQLRNIFLV